MTREFHVGDHVQIIGGHGGVIVGRGPVPSQWAVRGADEHITIVHANSMRLGEEYAKLVNRVEGSITDPPSKSWQQMYTDAMVQAAALRKHFSVPNGTTWESAVDRIIREYQMTWNRADAYAATVRKYRSAFMDMFSAATVDDDKFIARVKNMVEAESERVEATVEFNRMREYFGVSAGKTFKEAADYIIQLYDKQGRIAIDHGAAVQKYRSLQKEFDVAGDDANFMEYLRLMYGFAKNWLMVDGIINSGRDNEWPNGNIIAWIREQWSQRVADATPLSDGYPSVTIPPGKSWAELVSEDRPGVVRPVVMSVDASLSPDTNAVDIRMIVEDIVNTRITDFVNSSVLAERVRDLVRAVHEDFVNDPSTGPASLVDPFEGE